MTASFPENERKIFSQLTMALLLDTTWYEVDNDLIEALQYGKNQGCGFVVNHQCTNPSTGLASYKEFCVIPETAGVE